MNDKKLSIVIPTIGRTLLDKTIESVLAQDVLPYEIVVWDNSGDGTAYKQSKYKDTPNIKWNLSENKKDIISSWNCAVECTSGEYVYILGDDDLLLPGFIEKVLTELNNGAELIHTTAQIIDSDDKIIEEEKTNLLQPQEMTISDFINKFLNKGGRIYLGSIVFPKASYEKTGRFKDLILNALCMDILFNFEMLMLHKKITILAVPVWQYRSFVSDWSGTLKNKQEALLLINQCLRLRDYIKNSSLTEDAECLRFFVRNIIFSSMVRLVYLFDPRCSLQLLFHKNLNLKEKYYILRDLFYLIRHKN